MTEQRAPDDEALSIPAGYVSHLFDIAGRVAVVTGAGSGLGRAIAIGYAQAGAREKQYQKQAASMVVRTLSTRTSPSCCDQVLTVHPRPATNARMPA